MKTLHLAALALLLSSCAESAAAPDDSTLDDTSGNTWDDTVGDTSDDSGAAEVPGPVYLSVTVHLEAWPVHKPEVFERYVGLIRDYAEQVNAHGAVFTWETANLIDGCEQFGDNILADLAGPLGQAVGVHADLGGNPNVPYTQKQFTDDLITLRVRMEKLGVSPRHVSGVCSHLDWVQASTDAGYEAVAGVVEYCLKSLPESAQPAPIVTCASPAHCHDPYPPTVDERLSPWYMASGDDWTEPADSGLLLIPSTGALPCLAEAAEHASATVCTFDDADVDAALAELDAAIAARQPGQVNQVDFVWSFGGELTPGTLSRLLAAIRDRVDAGTVQWVSVPQLIDLVAAGG